MTQIVRNFSYVLPLLILLVPVVILVGFFIYRSRKKYLTVKESAATAVVDTFLVLSFAAILIITLFPQRIVHEPIARRVQLIPFADVTNISPYTLIENIGFNIFMFLPFGFFVSWRLSAVKVFRRVLLLGFYLSLCIELLQLLLPIGRSTTVDDIILNTLGTAIGSMIYLLLSKILPDSLLNTAFIGFQRRYS